MKLKDFIICDDIRTEINNKVSLIGVYNDSINFVVPESAADAWPKILRLGLFIRLALNDIEEKKKIGKLTLDFTINRDINFHAEQIIDADKQKTTLLDQMIISVVFNQINIPTTGEMEISLSIIDKEGELMEKITYPGNIKLNEIVQINNIIP